MVDDVSLDHVWDEVNRVARERYNSAPEATVEALTFSLRNRGVRALEEPDTQRRLSTLSDQQIIEAGDRLQNLKPEIARPWTADEIEAIAIIWSELR